MVRRHDISLSFFSGIACFLPRQVSSETLVLHGIRRNLCTSAGLAFGVSGTTTHSVQLSPSCYRGAVIFLTSSFYSDDSRKNKNTIVSVMSLNVLMVLTGYSGSGKYRSINLLVSWSLLSLELNLKGSTGGIVANDIYCRIPNSPQFHDPTISHNHKVALAACC